MKGFEEKDLAIPRDIPTVDKGAMRLLISIAVLKNWTLKTSDIKSAFLQGKELEREIYIKPQKKVRHHNISLIQGSRERFCAGKVGETFFQIYRFYSKAV